MLARFIVLQTIILGSGLGLYLMGAAIPLVSPGHILFPSIILGLTLLANAMAGWGLSYNGTVSKWYAGYRASQSALEGATWLSDLLPVVGLIFTVYSLLEVKTGLSGVVDIDSHKIQIFSDIVQALACNLFGMLGYAWVRVTLKVCGHD